MSDEQHDFRRIDVDPFELMDEGKALRGSPILKLAKNSSVKVEVREIIPRELSPEDIEDNSDWVDKEIAKMNERRVADGNEPLDYLPVITLNLTTLEDCTDADGGEISEGTELLFSRPHKNEFWDSFKAVSKHKNGKRKDVPFEVRIMRLSDTMGKYIATPT